MAQRSRRLPFWQRPVAWWNTAFTLAVWRWRTQRFLLLVVGLGIMVAVVLLSFLPLFTSVMTTAGLRSILRAGSNSAQIVANANIQGISTDQVAEATSQVNQVMKRNLGQYLAGVPQTTLITGNWYLNHGGFTMDFYGVPMQTAPSHLNLLQGHLPAENSASTSSIDIMLTPSAAFYMGGVRVGDLIPLSVLLLTKPAMNNLGLPGGPLSYVQTLVAHVVGIFQVRPGDAYWNGYTLEALPPASRQTPPPFLALTSQATLLTLFNTLSQQHQAAGVFFSDKSGNSVLLSYQLNVPLITGNRLGDVIGRLGKLQQDVDQTFIPASALTNLTSVTLGGLVLHDLDAASTLEKYQSQVEIVQTPTLILSVEIVCLVLFFISAMVSALVEREQMAIAVMRSRGSSRLQVLGSLLMQTLVLCLCAGLAGPLLAFGLTYLIAPHFLTVSTRDALNALTLDPGPVLRSLGAYTLAALAVVFLALLLTISLAVRANILTLRREEARAPRRPLWLRLRLDLLIATLAIAAYLLVSYLEHIQTLLSTQTQLFISIPMEIVAPLLLWLAGILFFLRFFPWVLRVLTRLFWRRRGFTGALALAQMERSPRQPARRALLLGLAMAFALFALVFSASQGQRAQDLATYQAVSDFGGSSTSFPFTAPEDAEPVLNQVSAFYRQIQGVTSVTVGYMDNRFLVVNGGTDQAYMRKTVLTAVDANSFAQTAFWNSQDSSQSLASLMALLVAHRQQAISQGAVPAIVASSTWQLLGLAPGMTFRLTDDFGDPDPTVYIAIAEVDHIPPVDDGTQGALLVDYQSLVVGRAHYQEATQPNYVWLRTSDNPAAVSHVRAALADPDMLLSNLVDRRALGSDHAVDPLSRSLLNMLDGGVIAALLLAFLANLLLPLLSARARQTSFAVLRSLGAAPAQITRILAWEMACVLVAALALGLVFGLLLAFTSVPPLVFSSVLPGTLASVSSTALYTLQQIVPVRIILPPSLPVALGLLLALSTLSLLLLTRLAQLPHLNQALLIDDD